jgi:serine/threonine protein kinase
MGEKAFVNSASLMGSCTTDGSQPDLSCQGSGKGQASAPGIPDHEVLRRIGAGSYGEVWLARTATGSRRAVKIVYRQSFDHDRPFEREFEGIKKFEPISHARESQIDIFQVGRNDAAGFFYYTMELADDATVDGARQLSELARPNRRTVPTDVQGQEQTVSSYVPRTLKHDLQTRGALPLPDCVHVAASLTRALDHLHTHGLVHRDIKPSNIIFVNGVPKLADIGLVTSIDATRSFVGTDGYIPPEGPGTPQADLYSLGKVLYECVTGKDRLDFPELPADWRTHPDFTQLIELNEVITKACDQDPRSRYASARAMQGDLALLQAGKSVKRHRPVQKWWAMGRRMILPCAVLTLATAIAVHISTSRVPNRGSPSYGLATTVATNPDAERFAATALTYIRGDFYDGFPTAYTNCYKSSKLDTNFALPWVGLLELRLREWHPALGRTTDKEMREIAQQLNTLARGSAAADCAQAVVSWFEWRFSDAKHFAIEAIHADENYELAHTWYGYLLAMWGDPVESRKQYEKSRKLLTAKTTVYRGLSRSYYMQGDYPRAISFSMTALDQGPHHIGAFGLLGEIYQAQGDYTNAIHWLEQEETFFGGDLVQIKQRYQALQQAFEKDWAPGYWREKWRQSEQNPSADPYYKAVIQMNLGNTNAALDWLETAYEVERQTSWHDSSGLNQLLVDPCWKAVREHPRFRQVLYAIGFTKVMPAKKQKG